MYLYRTNHGFQDLISAFHLFLFAVQGNKGTWKIDFKLQGAIVSLIFNIS